MNQLLITKTEVARRVGLTRYRVDQLIAAGVLPKPVGLSKLYPVARVEAALAAVGAVDANDKPERRP